eukprot:Ihof_evm1s1202 gene=Ihof_evmTU1s1202
MKFFDLRLKQLIMDLPGSYWDLEEKVWKIPYSSYDMLNETVSRNCSRPGEHVWISGIPRLAREIFKKKMSRDHDMTKRVANEIQVEMRHRLPQELLTQLKPYQLEGIGMMIQRGGRVLLGDEMGLGKTLQALTVAMFYSDDWPLLIVCPSSLRLTWAAEIQKWIPDKAHDIQIIFKAIELPMGNICIVSYDLIRKMPYQMLQNYKFIIADESHYLKSQDAQRTNMVCPLIKEASRALLLTGTPALSRPSELFTLLNALDEKIFYNRKGYE